MPHSPLPHPSGGDYTFIRSIGLSFLRASHDVSGSMQRGLSNVYAEDLGSINALFHTATAARDHVAGDAMDTLYSLVVAMVETQASETPVVTRPRIPVIVDSWRLKYHLVNSHYRNLPLSTGGPGIFQQFLDRSIAANESDPMIYVQTSNFYVTRDPHAHVLGSHPLAALLNISPFIVLTLLLLHHPLGFWTLRWTPLLPMWHTSPPCPESRFSLAPALTDPQACCAVLNLPVSPSPSPALDSMGLVAGESSGAASAVLAAADPDLVDWNVNAVDFQPLGLQLPFDDVYAIDDPTNPLPADDTPRMVNWTSSEPHAPVLPTDLDGFDDLPHA
ncbi:hypothetical protein IV203_023160 [Nitzschia inconspicua]|uniref:Uncharacterized protein n=1 Tax=Nitzschia inconspicua TaxID=303405 RepID=A0A9K3KCH6_9STRA|nr:hypothetical protein IV203_023160 [Nitzschia inconspicua]